MPMFRRRSAYLAKKLVRPLRTTVGGTLHTVLDARTYMVSLLKRRELRGQWQRACELLLTEADVEENQSARTRAVLRLQARPDGEIVWLTCESARFFFTLVQEPRRADSTISRPR
jgi:hypothetical protein